MGDIGWDEWMVVAVTAAIVTIAVTFHFEVINVLTRWAHRRARNSAAGHASRITLLVIMFALLLSHIVEVWLFAVGYWGLAATGNHGHVIGYEQFTLLDHVYFSATNYTTVGWGDLSAVGPLRFLAGTEALTGFLLLTWSASFTFLVMGRIWGYRDTEKIGPEGEGS